MGFGADIKGKNDLRLGEILSQVVPDDLIRYGLIPEFVGRFPVAATLNDLDEDDLMHIMLEPKNAIVKQYKKLMELDGVNLEFTQEALKAIAKKSLDRGTGARAIKSVMESIMLDMMFEIPDMKNVDTILVTDDVVNKSTSPEITFREIA